VYGLDLSLWYLTHGYIQSRRERITPRRTRRLCLLVLTDLAPRPLQSKRHKTRLSGRSRAATLISRTPVAMSRCSILTTGFYLPSNQRSAHSLPLQYGHKIPQSSLKQPRPARFGSVFWYPPRARNSDRPPSHGQTSRSASYLASSAVYSRTFMTDPPNIPSEGAPNPDTLLSQARAH
jgi:hypothetical protein